MTGYGTIEDKRIVVGYEKGKMGFMVEDIGAHQCLFLIHYIWRIAEYQVEMAVAIIGLVMDTGSCLLIQYGWKVI